MLCNVKQRGGNLYLCRFKYVCLDQEFCFKNLYVCFWEIGEHRNFFSNFRDIDRFSISKYTSCPNFAKNIDFWGSYVIFRFSDLQVHWPGFMEIAVGTFQSKAARDFKFWHFMPYMMLKVANYWASRKISSLRKIALPHQDRVKAIFGSSHLWIYEIKLCLLQAWVDCFRLDLDLRGKTAHIRSPLSLSFLDFEWVTFQ